MMRFDDIMSEGIGEEIRPNTPHWHKMLVDREPKYLVYHRGNSKESMAYKIVGVNEGDGIIEIELGEPVIDLE